jgi:hypothetical protein
MLKTLTQERARRIARLLGLDTGRREELLEHVAAARSHRSVTIQIERPMTPDEVDSALIALGEMHSVATYGAELGETRRAYADIVELGQATLARLDPRRHATARAQVLMFLHVVECALDRPDRALRRARDAARLLDEIPSLANRGDAIYHTRLRINAIAAEATSLQNLGLSDEAIAVAESAERLPAFAAARDDWTVPLLTGRLSALGGTRRFSASEAESLHDQARKVLQPDHMWSTLLDARLANTLLAHGAPRSRKKARQWIDDTVGRALHDDRLGALHSVVVLRVAARAAHQDGDRAIWEHHLHHCLDLATGAGLVHQRRGIEREYPSEDLTFC